MAAAPCPSCREAGVTCYGLTSHSGGNGITSSHFYAKGIGISSDWMGHLSSKDKSTSSGTTLTIIVLYSGRGWGSPDLPPLIPSHQTSDFFFLNICMIPKPLQLQGCMLQQKMKYLTIAFHVYFSVNLGYRVKNYLFSRSTFDLPYQIFSIY